MRVWNRWTPAEDAIIGEEVRKGKGFTKRLAIRLPSRSEGAIQMRRSQLAGLPERAIEKPQHDRKPPSIGPSTTLRSYNDPKVPEFLKATFAEMNARRIV